MKKHGIIFVTGIDTGVGKTVATGVLARSFMDQGLKTATVKLVETGNRGRTSMDVKVHRKLMKTKLPEDKEGLTSPAIFKLPASPALAAKAEGKKFDVKAAVAAARKVAGRYDVTLVEGAGGLMVPLTEKITTLDLIKAEKWPVAVVTCGRLGDINHSLLTLEALKFNKVKIASVVFNAFVTDADARVGEDCKEQVREWMKKNTPELELTLIKEMGK